MPAIIKIAPSKAEKEAEKKRQKEIGFLTSEKMVTPDSGGPKVVKSRRTYDRFMGGPLDGTEVSHQPNGPTLSFDPDRHWADYYFKDSMTLPGEFRRVEGFHMYSSSRALEHAFKYGIRHKNHGKSAVNLGTRGPNMVKLYYYIGFFENELLFLDGINPSDFAGILTL